MLTLSISVTTEINGSRSVRREEGGGEASESDCSSPWRRLNLSIPPSPSHFTCCLFFPLPRLLFSISTLKKKNIHSTWKKYFNIIAGIEITREQEASARTQSKLQYGCDALLLIKVDCMIISGPGCAAERTGSLAGKVRLGTGRPFFLLFFCHFEVRSIPEFPTEINYGN